MKSLIFWLLSLNIIFSSVFCGEWFEDWPETLDEKTTYYRGQRTDLASFDYLLEILMNENTSKVVTSRMFRTLQKLKPESSYKELVEISNEQLKFWEVNRMLWWIAECHADPYMCNLPKINQLMGTIFTKEDLPAGILEKWKKENGEDFDEIKISQKADILEFFDPVVSTSYRFDIALSFATDKNGDDGYVLILNDKDHRNCSAENKLTADCFINNEEFMEELEFPMWGYVLANEIEGFIVNEIRVYKNTHDSLKIENTKTNEVFDVNYGDISSCKNILSIKSMEGKLGRLGSSLFNKLGCIK